MNLENNKPDFVIYGSTYLFERAQHLMNGKDYAAALVVYLPDGKVKCRWRKR